MPKQPRDVERIYSTPEVAAKLRREPGVRELLAKGDDGVLVAVSDPGRARLGSARARLETGFSFRR